MANVKLLLQQPYRKGSGKKHLNPEETRLYAFLILDREHVIKIKTEHKIYPKEWDFDKQGKKENLAGCVEFNKELVELKEKFRDKYKEVIKKMPDMPFNQVATILKDYGKGIEVPFSDNEKGIFDILQEYIDSLQGEVAPNTIKKYVTLKASFQDFVKENCKYENLTFSQIDFKFKDAYIRYLRDREPVGRQKSRPEGLQNGLLNDTVSKYIKTLKSFCKWASEPGRDYNRYDFYESFEVTGKANKKRANIDQDIVTLTLAELKQFYEHDFSDYPSLDRVRDLFCFGVYTGQRWSDITQFDKSQLQGDIWRFTAQKTKKMTEIDLVGFSAPALHILRKYDYRLPKLSLTKFNLFLKKAGEIAKINETVKIRRYVGAKEILITKPKYRFLGSHTARKTCVSILLNDYNLNISHVKEITGHRDLDTLNKYINKDRQARREAVSKTTPITEIMKVTHRAG